MIRTALIAFTFFAPGMLLAQAHSVGVPPYHPVAAAKYRALYGGGGNLGLISDAPASELVVGSYQPGSLVFGMGFISNTSVGGFPRTTVSEFDFLLGFAWDEPLPRYQRPPNLLHFSFSAGVSLNSLSVRFSRFGQYYDTSFYYVYPYSRTEFSVGLPIQFQTIYEPMDNFGVGGLVFLNISNFTPSYGAAAVVEVRY